MEKLLRLQKEKDTVKYSFKPKVTPNSTINIPFLERLEEDSKQKIINKNK